MNKNRLEALSDGVFSIAMTLLVIDIAVPVFTGGKPTEAELAAKILELWPVFVSYFISFIVLAMFWISHNFFYNSITKSVNRVQVLLNMFYLSLIALIPFSAGLLGEYTDLKAAVFVYGLNVLAIGVVASTVLHYSIYSDEVDTHELESRTMKQARIRSFLTPFCTLVGLVVATWSLPVALFLYAFPIVFNVVPGLLNAAERVLGFKL